MQRRSNGDYYRAFMKSVGLAALVLVATAVLSAQEQRPVFRSGTALVPITVTVTDQQGRPVTGLKQADFKIFEDPEQHQHRAECGPSA